MPFDRGIDPATSDYLTVIMDDAWREADGFASVRLDPVGTHVAMVDRIVVAANQGECDHKRLHKLALTVARAYQPLPPAIQSKPASVGTVLRHYTRLFGLMVRFTV